METHVRLTAWLRIIWSVFVLMGALFVLLVFGGIGALIGTTGTPEEQIIAPWFMVFASFMASLLALLSVPGLVTGWGLLNYRPWARIANIILSGIDLFHMPVGTALGAYSIWVMLQQETVELFEARGIAGWYPTHF